MLKIIKRDILSVNSGVIAQQCNARGNMGAGLSLSIKNKWPKAFEAYRSLHNSQGLKLGSVVFANVDHNLWIANIIGQKQYGRDKSIVYTNYNALKKGLEYAYSFAAEKGASLYIPYKIGCGLANGDWNIVQDIIYEVAPEAIICRK